MFNATSFDNSSRYGGAMNLTSHNALGVPAFQTTFRVVSSSSPNCVSVSQIDIKGSKLFKTPLS